MEKMVKSDRICLKKVTLFQIITEQLRWEGISGGHLPTALFSAGCPGACAGGF